MRRTCIIYAIEGFNDRSRFMGFTAKVGPFMAYFKLLGVVQNGRV